MLVMCRNVVCLRLMLMNVDCMLGSMCMILLR